MAGHSQFKNIMHKEGQSRTRSRSKLFSEAGAGNHRRRQDGPARSHHERAAARRRSLPRAPRTCRRTISSARSRRPSGADAETYDEVRYEGYAPGGVAVIVEALTDNRNRTAGEVRSYFTKAGGSLAETGAVSFMFDHVGLIEFDRKAASEDAMLEAALEAGAEDVSSNEDGHEVITTLEILREVAQGARAEIRRAAQGGLVWRPQNTISVDDEAGEKILKLVGALEDNDDVQNVYANFEVSDALVAKMGA